MANRQDRRYAAKQARQALKGERSPTLQAILRAATDFLAGKPAEIDFSLKELDREWAHATQRLWDLLGEEFDAFRRDVFEQASSLALVAPIEGEDVRLDFYTILFPVVGERRELLSFVADERRRSDLAQSLRASGVIPEHDVATIAPTLLEQGCVDFYSTGPAGVSKLTASLVDYAMMSMAGGEKPSADDMMDAISDHAFLVAPDGELKDPISGFVLGIVATRGSDQALTEAEAETRSLAFAAATESWHDTYASQLPFRLGSFAIWSEAGAVGIWQTTQNRIEASLAQRGSPGQPVDVHVCYDAGNDAVLVAARSGATWVGPFEIPNVLVFTDVDVFAEEAERFAETVLEYERPEKLRKLVSAGGEAGR